MVKQTIRIFCRVKPTRQKSGIFSVDHDESSVRSTIEYVVPKDMADGFINNKRESYKFAFERVFEQHSKQDEVFEHVAKDVIDNVLAGYNGTIFAYGQTGSGKTFTITGGAEKFSDRGIIPRALSYIFEKYENDKEHIHTTEISYLEIYNDSGYDLLDPRHEAAKLEDLPKVALMEDPDQCIHLKNLSVLPAQGIEEALNLLFLGDTNRMIAETPMNQASTRSHCIFTIHVTSREPGSATIRRSKLHLVDLAGSERVTKSNVGGQLLTEAKYINLSLHFLEQVIVALSEKNRQHIPYRNSMMTSVLRDSLGGNCMTTMIATVAVDKRNIDESISTCRFAQRVALIKNEATLNEELDPKLMIIRLKKEIQSLKDELGLVTGEERSDKLTKEEIEQLDELIKTYLEDSDLEATLDVGGDMRKIQYSYKTLKNHALKQGTVVNALNETVNGDFSDANTTARSSSHEENSLSPMEVKRLKEILMQRDNEINILVTMLKKERKRALDAEAGIGASGNTRAGVSTAPEHRTSAYNRSAYESEPEGSGDSSAIESKSRVKDPEMSAGRHEAYEIFKQTYVHNQTIVDQKERLKQRYSEAKTLGMQVNEARTTMNTLKADLDLMRKRKAIQAAMNESTEEDSFEENEREALIRQQMEEVKIRYKDSFTKLKAMKAEIDHLHHLLDKTRVQMQRDFDIWWEQQSQRETVRTPSTSFRIPSGQQKEVNGLPPERQNPLLPPRQVRPEEAWRTPPESPLRHGSTSGNALLPMPPINSLSVTETRLSNSGASRGLFRQPGNAVPHLAAQFKPNSPMGFAPSGAFLRESQGGHESSHSAPSFQARGADITNRPQRSFSSGQHGLKNANGPKLPLTGDRETDANILAFIKARETLMQRGGK